MLRRIKFSSFLTALVRLAARKAFSGKLMLQSYFDASIDKELAVVSGYLSTAGKWESFEIDWRLLLAKENVPYFHMKEFTVSTGPFAKWKGDERRRARFLGALAEIIRSHVLCSFATLVSPKDYEKVDQQFQLRERAGNPYSFCGRNCRAEGEAVGTSQRLQRPDSIHF